MKMSSCKEEGHQNVDVLSYCESKLCLGFPMKVSPQEIDEGFECPVCYEPLKSEKVVRFNKCKHALCMSCAEDFYRRECLMCGLTNDKMLTLSRAMTSEIDWEISTGNHRHCRFYNMNPVVKEYLAELNDGWMTLAEFMFTATQHPEDYKGIKGIECLNLSQYEDEDRLLEKGKCHAVLKTAEDKKQVLISCLLPCMSLRLLITPNEDTDIDEDDTYADEAVGFINKQLKACWQAFARLVNKDSLDHLIVRKFRNVTCSVLLSGFDDRELAADHDAQMKEQLGALKKHNFNASQFGSVRLSFPVLKRISVDSQEHGDCSVFGGFTDSDDSDDEEKCGEDEDDSEEDEVDVTANEIEKLDEESSDEKVDEADNDDEYFARLIEQMEILY